MINRRFQVGDKVHVRFRSNIERERWGKRRAVGQVVEGRDLPDQGYCVRVQRTEEDSPSEFYNAGQFDPA